MIPVIKKFKQLLIVFLCYFSIIHVSNAETQDIKKSNVMSLVKQVEEYVKQNGIEKTIIAFKNANNIFIGDYDGMYFVSPLHPELIGKNQFNYQDPTGAKVVQEEINKAKEGGGWLAGRLREVSSKKYQCRKIYIFPVAEKYYIGSWYHYSPNSDGKCLV